MCVAPPSSGLVQRHHGWEEGMEGCHRTHYLLHTRKSHSQGPRWCLLAPRVSLHFSRTQPHETSTECRLPHHPPRHFATAAVILCCSLGMLGHAPVPSLEKTTWPSNTVTTPQGRREGEVLEPTGERHHQTRQHQLVAHAKRRDTPLLGQPPQRIQVGDIETRRLTCGFCTQTGRWKGLHARSCE